MQEVVPGDVTISPIQRPAVSVDVARHVLLWFGDYGLGRTGGDFVDNLIGLIAKADLSNRAKLALAFPDYAAAYNAVANEHWGMEWLRNKVLDAEVQS